MKRLSLLLAFVSFAAVAFAQGGSPADEATPTTHFSVSASALGFSGGGSSSAATIAGGSVALTKRIAVGYQQVIVPSLSANYYLGTVSYTMPLPSLLGKTLNSKLVFDSSKWSTTFFGGAGVLRQDLTGDMEQHIASTVGAGLNYTADGHITIQVISGQWIHAGVAGEAGNFFLVTPNTAAISSGLKLTF
jgi:hypothetical protein